MSSPLMGTVAMFGFNFAPLNWAFCQGQLLQISQNTALFSLLGTIYGGNGQTTFALPDLRGRAPVGQGQGPATPLRTMGEVFGSDSVTLSEANLASHTHAATMHVKNGAADQEAPGGRYLAAGVAVISGGTGAAKVYSDVTPDNTLASDAVTNANAGTGTPFSVDQPSLVLNYCIALMGIYPSRN